MTEQTAPATDYQPTTGQAFAPGEGPEKAAPGTTNISFYPLPQASAAKAAGG